MIKKNNKLNLELISIEEFFKDYKSISLNENELIHFLNGAKLQTDKKDGVYKIYNSNSFVGTGIVSNNSLKRDIVL